MRSNEALFAFVSVIILAGFPSLSLPLRTYAMAVLLYVPTTEFLQTQPAITHPRLKTFRMYWNATLSALSALGFILVFEPAYRRTVITTFFYSKVVEFVDTGFLCLSGKRPSFLHVSHHALTALYCLFCLHTQVKFTDVACAANMFVHAIMYAYFARPRLLRPIRLCVTILQVAQMWFGLALACHGRIYNNQTHPLVYAGIAMYGFYTVIFGKLFIKLYT